MGEQVEIRTLKNGLTVITQRIDHLESAAYALHIPLGLIHDSADKIGATLVLPELISRGAGPYNSQELVNAFDGLGIRHSEGAGLETTSLSGTLVADQLKEAIRLLGLMVKEATLPEEEIASIKSLLFQDIRSMLDNPARKVMVELRKRYFPEPFNRPGIGEHDGIEAVTRDLLVKMYREDITPRGSVLSVAGKIDPDQVFQWAEEFLGDWEGDEQEEVGLSEFPSHAVHHIETDSAQLQIALGYPSAKINDDEFFEAKLANQILSGGMFGRLFIEVREKRGLCYSVYSQHTSTGRFGNCFAYAGTTPDRAQETLDVLVAELRRLKGTISNDELERGKANSKAALIMSQESPGARASYNATDWWWRKRVRTLEEVEAGINSVTAERIDTFLDKFPPSSMMVVTLGSRALQFPGNEG